MKIRQKRVLAYVLAIVMVLNLCAVPVKAEEGGSTKTTLTTDSMSTNISNSTMYFVHDSANQDYSYNLTITKKDEAVDDITLDVSKLCISASDGYDSSLIKNNTYTSGDVSLTAAYSTSKPTCDTDFKIDGNSTGGFDIKLSDKQFPEKKNKSFILWCQNAAEDRWYYVATFEVSIKEYKINYNLGENGNFKKEYTAPSEFCEGDKVTLPNEKNIEANDGYTFAGWYLNEEYTGDRVAEVSQVNADANKTVTLYAKWTEKTKYKISYNLGENGKFKNEYKAPSEFYEGAKVTLPAEGNIEVNDGYIFEGWYLNEEYTGDRVTEVSQVNADANKTVTLYAKWTEKTKYSISYNLGENGKFKNEYKAPSEFYEGAKVTLPAEGNIEVNDGYTFAGWYLNEEYTGDRVTEVSQVNADANKTVTLYAKWTEKTKYKISYNLGENGKFKNEYKAPSEFYEGAKVTLPAEGNIEVNDGYTFAGWYLNEEYTGDRVTEVSQVNADANKTVTLYAKWTEKTKYKISYNLGENGKFKNEYKAPSEFYEGAKVTLPAEGNIEVNDGYTFAGWYLNEEYTGDRVTEVSQVNADANKTVTLYAKWTEKTKYKISYNLGENGKFKNEYKAPSEFYEGAKVTLPAEGNIEVNDGYTFAGWYLNEEYTGDRVTEVSQVNADANKTVTLYAKWTEKTKYKISYNLGENGKFKNEYKAPSEFYEGAKVTLPAEGNIEVNDGYTFAGWYLNEEYTGDRVTEVSQVNADANKTVTLYAKWTEKTKYSISYNLGENGKFKNEYKAPSEFYEGAKVTLPAEGNIEVNDGYIFEGWYLNEKYTGDRVTEVSQANADDNRKVTLYAKWISTSPSPSPSDNSLTPSPSPTKDPSPSVAPAPTLTPSVQPTESTDRIKINGKDVKNNQKISVCLGDSITITASSKITIVPKAKRNQKKCLKVSVKNNKGTIKVNSLCKNAIKVIITEKSKKTSTTIWINTKVPTPKFKVKINKSRTKFTITIKNKSVAKKIGCYTVEAKNKNTKNKFVYIATDKFKVVTSGGKKYPEGKYSFRITFWNTKKPVKKGKFINKYMHQSQVFNLTVKRK